MNKFEGFGELLGKALDGASNQEPKEEREESSKEIDSENPEEKK